ncbi:MAG TPA: hypothetical protein VKV74_03785 [Bryobacteraceae bacterium]|nr:hypothetical protein [Bryobacteraceae bacterium]
MSPVDLLVEIIKEHSPEDIWQGSPLIGYRLLGNTNRGAIGEEFVRRYLTAAGIKVSGAGRRTSLTDMQIGANVFEIKTASMGANKTFQFNHIRMDRKYDYLLCLGICPGEPVFNMCARATLQRARPGIWCAWLKGKR